MKFKKKINGILFQMRRYILFNSHNNTTPTGLDKIFIFPFRMVGEVGASS